MLPSLIRQVFPNAKIGYFLHFPFLRTNCLNYFHSVQSFCKVFWEQI
ncbi:MAG TPA: hypothetical protein PLG79_07800 [Spirochaetales bacterium]|nr:hypothetical protein [Spirochaetales bacterium]